MNKQLNKQGIIRFWFVQIGVVLLLTIFLAIMYDARVAYSAFLGGVVCVVPNVFFAVRLFKYQGARVARHIVTNFYKGEALKIGLSIVLFSLVFAFCNVIPAAFFISYVLVLMTHWLSPWIIVNQRNRPKSD